MFRRQMAASNRSCQIFADQAILKLSMSGVNQFTIKMSGNNYCWEHELYFPTEESFLRHKKNECEKYLSAGNVCLYMDQAGNCCGQTFMQVSSLILHYLSEHEVYACVHCYETFISLEGLEQHQHTQKNIREGEWKHLKATQKDILVINPHF